MDIDDTKVPIPDGTASPLFEPEVPTKFSIPDLPALATTDATEIIDLSSLTSESTVEKDHASPYIQKLRALEADAIQEISSWDPEYLRQDPEVTMPGHVAGTKRKAAEIEDGSDSDLDDDETDDEDDCVPPYDPDQQKRPKLPLYHPGFQLTQKMAQDILSTLIQYITKSIRNGYTDAEATHLREELVRNKEVPYQEILRICLAGMSGAGKSALLNALMGVVNLNVEGDNGEACTCVITEYVQAPPSQTKSFAARVEFFDVTVCVKMVTDLFTQWYNAKQKQRQDPDDLDDEEVNRMTTAQECFRLLFANRLEQNNLEEFLSTATSARDQKIIKQLTVWTVAIHKEFVQPGKNYVYFESSTPEGIKGMFHPFTANVANASFREKPMTCSPWPFVKIVRVYLKSPLLEQSVIFVDIPGGADSNHFRRDNANRYLQDCQMTIVVAKLTRMITDSIFSQQYLEAYRRRRTGSVILVGTFTDIVNTENISTSGYDLTVEDESASITNKVNDIEKAIRIISNDISRNSIDGKSKDNKALKKRKRKLTSRKNVLTKQLKEDFIAARNKKVAVGVAEKYRENTGDDAGAPVYCVSSFTYMRHVRGYDKTDPSSIPDMTLDSTQIPALCTHLYALSSRGKTSDLDHFARVTVPSLLNIVQMSVSTTKLARVKHLTSIVQTARQDIDARIKKLVLKFNNTDIKLLHDELADPALQTRFDKQAMKNLLNWEDMNAASHRATCRKQGTYVQKKKNIDVNWNEALLGPVQPHIEAAFRSIIDDSCDRFEAEATQEVKEVIAALEQKLENDPKALACDAYSTCFKKNVSLFYETINRYVSAAAKKLKNGMINIHLRAIRLGDQTDYFPKAMSPIYDAAFAKKAAGKGKTMKTARQQYLKEAIPGPMGAFAQIAVHAKTDAEDLITQAGKELEKNLNGILRSVQRDFDSKKTRKDDDTEQGKKFRKGLHELVGEARRILNGVTQESLDLCKQYK